MLSGYWVPVNCCELQFKSPPPGVWNMQRVEIDVVVVVEQSYMNLYHILDCLEAGSGWILLRKGERLLFLEIWFLKVREALVMWLVTYLTHFVSPSIRRLNNARRSFSMAWTIPVMEAILCVSPRGEFWGWNKVFCCVEWYGLYAVCVYQESINQIHRIML